MLAVEKPGSGLFDRHYKNDKAEVDNIWHGAGSTTMIDSDKCLAEIGLLKLSLECLF